MRTMWVGCLTCTNVLCITWSKQTLLVCSKGSLMHFELSTVSNTTLKCTSRVNTGQLMHNTLACFRNHNSIEHITPIL